MCHTMHHLALELDVAVIALGHYASETTGPLAMQKLIGETFDVETLFAEIPTGL
jgi:putative NIF3 family GTP cyclohydrolase 1 type 2